MTISIRPHHLLCMLTYLGKGYTPDFVHGYNKIIRRLNAGEAIEIVSGPDDICRPMLSEDGCHCHDNSVRDRDTRALAQVGRVLGIDLENGEGLLLTPERISVLRTAFLDGSVRAACTGCEWYDLCSEISDGGYRACRLSIRAAHGKDA